MWVVLVEVLPLLGCLLDCILELVAFTEDLLIEGVHDWIFPQFYSFLAVQVAASFLLLKLLIGDLLRPSLGLPPLIEVKPVTIAILLLFVFLVLHSKL